MKRHNKVVDIKVRDNNGKTPLHYLLVFENIASIIVCLNILLDENYWSGGSDLLSIEDNDGKIPYDYAPEVNNIILELKYAVNKGLNEINKESAISMEIETNDSSDDDSSDEDIFK